MVKRSHLKPSRLDSSSDNSYSKLPSRSRKQRKRLASKKRRVQLKLESDPGGDLEGGDLD